MIVKDGQLVKKGDVMLRVKTDGGVEEAEIRLPLDGVVMIMDAVAGGSVAAGKMVTKGREHQRAEGGF